MLRELLKGLEACRPQAVANMIMIPLVGQESEYELVGTVADIYLDRDVAYDRLTMASNAVQPTIMPAGFTLLTKEKAQDRAVANKTIIAANKKAEVNAFCVQSSQCGLMNKAQKDAQQRRMLPVTVRKAAYAHRDERNFGALWNSLSNYNQSMGVTGNFLVSFFDKLKDQLDQFIAEFELVPYQRGAIILINDQLIGVEISPNPLVWSAQWEMLIRDCYGSEAISKRKDYRVVDESAILADATTLEELAEKLEKLEDREFEFAERQVSTVLAQQETLKDRQSEAGLKVVDVETPDFIGQAVRRNGSIIDLTLLRRDVGERGFRFTR